MGRQLDVMAVLWEHESGTVAEVMTWLNDTWEPEIAYTTTLTYLRTLRQLGWAQAMREEHADRYFPALTIDHARWLALDYLTDHLFRGSRDALLEYLVGESGTSRYSLERLEIVLKAALARTPRRAAATAAR